MMRRLSTREQSARKRSFLYRPVWLENRFALPELRTSLHAMPAPFPAPFESYIAPARARPEIWRLLAGLCLVGIGYTVLAFAAIAAYAWLTSPGTGAAPMAAIVDAATPSDTLALLGSFAGMGLAVILVVKYLHRRPAGTLFGRAPVVIRDFTDAAALVAAVYSVPMIIWFLRFDAVPQLDPSLWLLLLPAGILGLLIQTGSEELVFRGYLQQQLAARFRWRLIWLVLPSLLFGAAHYDPAVSGGNVWLVIAATTIFALAAADLTAATGSIGAAWGFHFANNFAAIMVLSVKGTIPGLALFTTPYAADQTEGMIGLVMIDAASMALAWFLVRRALQR